MLKRRRAHTHCHNHRRSANLLPSRGGSSSMAIAAPAAWARCPSARTQRAIEVTHAAPAARDTVLVRILSERARTSMPCRPSGTGVFMLDGESVCMCMSSAHGDDASHSADTRIFWCAHPNSGDVATTRSARSAHAECGVASIFSPAPFLFFSSLFSPSPFRFSPLVCPPQSRQLSSCEHEPHPRPHPAAGQRRAPYRRAPQIRFLLRRGRSREPRAAAVDRDPGVVDIQIVLDRPACSVNDFNFF